MLANGLAKAGGIGFVDSGTVSDAFRLRANQGGGHIAGTGGTWSGAMLLILSYCILISSYVCNGLERVPGVPLRLRHQSNSFVVAYPLASDP
jgi:hypothetical protein